VIGADNKIETKKSIAVAQRSVRFALAGSSGLDAAAVAKTFTIA
jgi:hypothetical protein